MTTLTATPLPETGAIRLTITKTGTVDYILRSDVNGQNEVRVLTGQLPSAGTGLLILEDYEAADGLVTYTVFGAGGTAQASTQFALSGPWLFVPIIPEYSQAVETVTEYDAARESRSVEHIIIGRPDPIVVLDILGTRKGNLEIWCPDHAATVAVANVFSKGETVMLRQPEHDGMDMYFTASNLATKPYAANGAATRWAVTCSFTEVARPIGPRLGSLGWSFGQLATSAPSFAVVAERYASFADMLTDQRKDG